MKSSTNRTISHCSCSPPAPRKAPGLGEGEDFGNVTAGSEVAEGLCSSASEVDDFGDEAKPSIFFVGKP